MLEMRFVAFLLVTAYLGLGLVFYKFRHKLSSLRWLNLLLAGLYFIFLFVLLYLATLLINLGLTRP